MLLPYTCSQSGGRNDLHKFVTSSTRKHLTAQVYDISYSICASWTACFQLIGRKQTMALLPSHAPGLFTSEPTEALLWKAQPDSRIWLFCTCFLFFWWPFLSNFLLSNSYWSPCTFQEGASFSSKPYWTFQTESASPPCASAAPWVSPSHTHPTVL